MAEKEKDEQKKEKDVMEKNEHGIYTFPKQIVIKSGQIFELGFIDIVDGEFEPYYKPTPKFVSSGSNP
jgi:hypothetical protein